MGTHIALFSKACQVLDVAMLPSIAPKVVYPMSVPKLTGPRPKEKSEAAENLSKNVKRLLDEKKLEAPGLAKAARMGQRTVYNIIEQSHFCGINQLDKIARYAGVAPWQLLLGDAPIDLFAVIMALQQDKDLGVIVQTYLGATEEGKRLMTIFSRGVPRADDERGAVDGDAG